MEKKLKWETPALKDLNSPSQVTITVNVGKGQIKQAMERIADLMITEGKSPEDIQENCVPECGYGSGFGGIQLGDCTQGNYAVKRCNVGGIALKN